MLTMTGSQQAVVSIKVKDKGGNPAKVDGVPEWGTDNSDIVSLSPSEDGMSCTVRAVGPLGNAKVSVTCDADLGEGVKLLVGQLDVTIGAGEAAVIELEAGSPEEQA